MPYTPFHFGPSSTIGMLLYKKLDVFVFVLINVIIDIEPFLVMVFNFHYPLHGYAHTFIGAGVLGCCCGALAWVFRGSIRKIMNRGFKLPYEPLRSKMMIAGVFGASLHVFLDSVLYPEMQPFYPLRANLMFGFVDYSGMYLWCAMFFIPAVGLYWFKRNKHA